MFAFTKIKYKFKDSLKLCLTSSYNSTVIMFNPDNIIIFLKVTNSLDYTFYSGA